jgi:hypothetical protein
MVCVIRVIGNGLLDQQLESRLAVGREPSRDVTL